MRQVTASQPIRIPRLSRVTYDGRLHEQGENGVGMAAEFALVSLLHPMIGV
jgi:hypothetical protein